MHDLCHEGVVCKFNIHDLRRVISLLNLFINICDMYTYTHCLNAPVIRLNNMGVSRVGQLVVNPGLARELSGLRLGPAIFIIWAGLGRKI